MARPELGPGWPRDKFRSAPAAAGAFRIRAHGYPGPARPAAFSTTPGGTPGIWFWNPAAGKDPRASRHEIEFV